MAGQFLSSTSAQSKPVEPPGRASTGEVRAGPALSHATSISLGAVGRLWRRLGRVTATVVAGLALAGCSLSLIYPRLDTPVSWQLDRYLRLETGQERWLDERLEERLAWHQREQLPHWREAVATLRADIADGKLDAERHQQLNERARDLLRTSMTGLIDDTAQLAAGLTETQVTHLLEHVDEETDELKEELAEQAADPTETVQERLDNLQDDIEQWFGRISKEQREYVAQWDQQAIRWGDYALDSRQRWRDFIVQALAQRADTVATRMAVEQMFLQPERLRSEAYQAAIAQHTAHRRALHLYLLQTMSEKQKQRLLGELDDLLEELDELLTE